MIKRFLTLLLILLCLCPAAQAGGKETHLIPQEGEYEPEYSVTCTFEVEAGRPFELIVYRDRGTLPLRAVRNGGNVPPGMGVYQQDADGDALRQATLQGTVYTEGSYSFGVLIQEQTGNGKEMRTLAILNVTLNVVGEVEKPDPYIGDGNGMLRVVMDGVNFRRTPGGTRLDVFDEGERFVWCDTREKGGYTWYRVWSEDYGYGYLRGDMVQEEPPLRIVYTPGKETAFTLFITPGGKAQLTPSLIMTEAPEEIGFDTEPLVNVSRGGDIWTLLCFRIEEEKSFWIQVDLRDENGVPLECQLVYMTTRWEEVPEYVSN